MDFKILDASAFYAGIPFGTISEFHTTSLIYDEIKHIKKSHDALGILLETKRLKIMDPDKQHIDLVIKKAKKNWRLPTTIKTRHVISCIMSSTKWRIDFR